MPSRKKAKGKARKAAKQAKAKEEESRAVEVAAGQRQEESVEVQLQRLIINATSPKLCRHGLVPLPSGEQKICLDFINAFKAPFHSDDAGFLYLGEVFLTAYDATKVEYADVYASKSKLDTVISMLLSCGTQLILDGDNRGAELYAMLASHFEEYMAVEVHITKATASWSKVYELCDTDVHTLVSYYRKRIPCDCLDQKYKEVKSVKKMGFCYNPGCSLPGRNLERSKMFSCTRCGNANYCSVECQRANWKDHRKHCNRILEMKDAFKSEHA